MAVNRQQRLLKQGLPGSASFELSDLSDNDIISWDAVTNRWVIDTLPAAGVTDHGALTGLADDDHPQYAALAQDETIAGEWRFDAGLIAGDPGTENSAITVNNTSYESVLKVSDIGSANEAQFHMHRHSDTLPPVLIGSRSRGETSSHAAVADNDILLTLLASGWDGVDTYSLSSEIRFEVDGTPGDNDMPGQITFMTAVDGTQVPVERMRIRADGSVEIGDTTDYASLSHDGTDFNTAFTNTADWNITGARVVTPASISGRAGLNIPEGTAPSSPNDGDVWVTTTDIVARINGVSESLLGGGADPWTYDTLASDDTNTTTTPQVALSFTPAADTLYMVEWRCMMSTDATNVDSHPGMSWNTGNDTGVGAMFYNVVSTTGLGVATAFFEHSLYDGTDHDFAFGTGQIANREYPFWGWAIIDTGNSPSGDFEILHDINVATNTSTMRAGSHLRYREL